MAKGTPVLRNTARAGMKICRTTPAPAALSSVAMNRKPWHASGCPCCSPPSGAPSWQSPKKTVTRAPISFGTAGAKGEIIECEAVVAMGVDKLETKKIKVAPPGPGEVRLKVVANAICHTDIYTLEGSDPEGIFPSILGHEAGTVVESIGAGSPAWLSGTTSFLAIHPSVKSPTASSA